MHMTKVIVNALDTFNIYLVNTLPLIVAAFD